jgi:hypothetical protein
MVAIRRATPTDNQGPSTAQRTRADPTQGMLPATGATVVGLLVCAVAWRTTSLPSGRPVRRPPPRGPPRFGW